MTLSQTATIKGKVQVAGTILPGAERQSLINEIVSQLEGNIRVAKIREVTLLAEAWVGEENVYSQVVSLDGVTENSQVNLTPSVEQLEIFHNKDLTFVTKNESGIVTVFVVGQKPTNNYTMQVTITEVEI